MLKEISQLAGHEKCQIKYFRYKENDTGWNLGKSKE